MLGNLHLLLVQFIKKFLLLLLHLIELLFYLEQLFHILFKCFIVNLKFLIAFLEFILLEHIVFLFCVGMSILIPKLLSVIFHSRGLLADLIYNLLHCTVETGPLIMVKVCFVFLVVYHVIHDLLQNSLWVLLIRGHEIDVNLLRSSLSIIIFDFTWNS